MTPGSRQDASCNVSCFLSDGTGEVYFVPQRNAEITRPGDLRLTLPRSVYRPRSEGCQSEAAALVEAERADVVVGGGQRDLVAALALGLGAAGLDQHRADALVQVEGVDGGDLEDRRPHLEGDQAGDAAG